VDGERKTALDLLIYAFVSIFFEIFEGRWREIRHNRDSMGSLTLGRRGKRGNQALIGFGISEKNRSHCRNPGSMNVCESREY